MRFVHITPDLPSRHSANGGATRQFFLLKRLLETGHHVTVIAPVNETRAADIPDLTNLGFEVRAVRRPRSRVVELLRAMLRRPGLLMRLFTFPGTPFLMEIFWTSLQPVVQAELVSSTYDCVIVEHDYAVAWVRDIDRDCPVVSAHECMTGNYTSTLAESATGFRRALYRWEAKRYENFTPRWLSCFDAVVSVSEYDAELARGYLRDRDVPIYVIPNGADCKELAMVGDDPDHETVLFTGTLAYTPNADAARWLTREIWPLVLEARPQVKLFIVGRDPTADVLALDEPPHLNVTGAVPSMLPYFAEASVCVAPVRIGGGTRLKIIEAWAAGRAVVSNTVGATGLDVDQGENILIADDARGFADAILELLEDGDKRAALAQAGRETALAKYDWKSLGDRFEAALTSADTLVKDVRQPV